VEWKATVLLQSDVDEKRTNLRREVLKHLGLNSLDEFKGKVLLSSMRSNADWTSARRKCAAEGFRNLFSPFLEKRNIGARPEVIFCPWKLSKHVLQHLPEFRDLQHHKITDGYDKMLSGYRVVLCVYPGGQTGTQKQNKAHILKSQRQNMRLWKTSILFLCTCNIDRRLNWSVLSKLWRAICKPLWLMVQRAGFEPANPYGKGFLIGRSSQSVDLESLVEALRCALSPLTWLGSAAHSLTKSESLLINHFPLFSSLLSIVLPN